MTIELGPFPDEPLHDRAAALDAADPLRGFRDRFTFADPDVIYLDGNSLGRLPRASLDAVSQAAAVQWGERLISSWNDGWWDLQLELGDKLAPLVGAAPGEVIISDSTSVNLHKLASGAMAARPDRTKIVTDDLNFPSDLYILAGVADAVGGTLEIVTADGVHGPVEALVEALDSETALLALSHTAFGSGYTYDITEMTARAHDVGALTLWDCSHSVGVVPISFEEWDVDLAVGCTYKYLNGGPGSPAFLYVREAHHDSLPNPIQGWWAHADPFALEAQFRPTSGIRRFHTGTMPILSLVPVGTGLDAVLAAGVQQIREKSMSLTEFFLECVSGMLDSKGFEVASPMDPSERGSHISLTHADAWPITRSLVELARVVPDFRHPESIRFGLAPLYTSFEDVHTAVQRLRRVVDSGLHRQFVDATATVT